MNAYGNNNSQIVDYLITKDNGILYNFKGVETLINPGCFKELTTELNGDNVVASVNLSVADIRSCMNSNKYSDKIYTKDGWVVSKMPANSSESKNELAFGYRHLKDLGNGLHIISVYEEVDGSMGSFSSKLLVRFVKKTIFTLNNQKLTNKTVDVIERIGEIEKEGDINKLNNSEIQMFYQN